MAHADVSSGGADTTARQELVEAASAVWSQLGRSGAGLPEAWYFRLHQASVRHLRDRFRTCFTEAQYLMLVDRCLQDYLAPLFLRHMRDGASGPDEITTALDNLALDALAAAKNGRELWTTEQGQVATRGAEDEALVGAVFPESDTTQYERVLEELCERGQRLDFIVVQTIIDVAATNGGRRDVWEVAGKLASRHFPSKDLVDVVEEVQTVMIRFAYLLGRTGS